MRQVLSRQVLGKGVLTAAAASSLLSIATGAAYAHPGAMAEASHSPGVLSGNSVSVPITFSPNVCGNSVDGGAALNPSMGNTCATSTGSDTGHHDYERYLSPENAEAFERYLEEHPGGRHALPGQRREDEGGYGEHGGEAPRTQGPRHAAPRPEEARPEAPRHASTPRHEDAYGGPGEEDRGPRGGEEECDDHPPAPHAQHPAPHPAPPAPAPHHPQPKPQPKPAPQPRPAPAPAPPAAQPAPVPAPAPAPAPHAEAPVPPQEHAQTLPAPVEEQPHTLPAPVPAPQAQPAPAPAPVPGPPAQELPAPRPPHGSQPERPLPAPVPVPDVVRPADQPPAAPAGDLPVHLPPAPAPAPVPAAAPPVTLPAPAPAQAGPQLAATGAGELGAMAALASALVLGGAILYRRSSGA
ncbi:chaplin [Streptomyces racemochromogenes]|uniref:Chaplin n=1 Tax=Streptomyces racemochromogenes TaxID=67353 RepID=A0ABW7PP37_9ACTN